MIEIKIRLGKREFFEWEKRLDISRTGFKKKKINKRSHEKESTLSTSCLQTVGFVLKGTYHAHFHRSVFTKVSLHDSKIIIILILISYWCSLQFVLCLKQAVPTPSPLNNLYSDWLPLTNRWFKYARDDLIRDICTQCHHTEPRVEKTV